MPSSVWNDSLAGHKERLREHIVLTAAELVAERGANVPMSLLARRAGIARTTLYNYFPDFERVLGALVTYEVTRFRRRLDQRLAESSDPAQRLRTYLVEVGDWSAGRRRQDPGSAHRPASHKLPANVITAMHEPLTELREMLTGILADGVAAEIFRANLDPEVCAEFVLRLVLDPAIAEGPPVRDQLLPFVEHALYPRGPAL